MIIAMLLGAGAMVAGARGGGNSGLANAGAAAMSAPGEVIQRTLLSYVRQQEENADKAGVKFLNATGQSARGMYETFKRFTDESLFAARGADPYVQSHPMPAERVRALEELARSSPYWDKKDDPALQMRHDMVRAKISGFMERQDTVYRRYPLSNTSLPARYARAITTYLHGDLRSALAQIDGLIQLQPANPYFYELRGQALLEGGKPAEAIAPLRKAVQLSNNAPLIEMLLGQALVASDNKAYTDEAIAHPARGDWRARPRPRSATCSSRWPMAARATTRRPIWHRPRPPTCAATTRPRAISPRGPRPASRSGPRDGSKLTIL